MVLFQDCDGDVLAGKTNVFMANCQRLNCKLTADLLCEQVGRHSKPTSAPSLSDEFKVAENLGIAKTKHATSLADETEFLKTVTKCVSPI